MSENTQVLPSTIAELAPVKVVVGVAGEADLTTPPVLPQVTIGSQVEAKVEEVNRAKRSNLLPSEIRARDEVLQVLRSLHAEDGVAEASGYGLGLQESSMQRPFGGDEEEFSHKHVSEQGGLVARADLPYVGHSVWHHPLMPPRMGVVKALDESYNAYHTVSEAQQKEVQALSRQVPRTAVPGTPQSVYATVNGETAKYINRVQVKGLVVHTILARHALTTGYRPSVLPGVPYQVVVSPIGQRSANQNDPLLMDFTEVAMPAMNDHELAAFAALSSPGGFSNFQWVAAPGDPNNPQVDDAMHAGSRNILPGGVERQLYYTNSVVGRAVAIGGNALTLLGIEQLLNRFSRELPQVEMEDAYASAAAYLHVYPSPRPDRDNPEQDEITGARVVNYFDTPHGRVEDPDPGPHPPFEPPVVDPNWLPDWNDDGVLERPPGPRGYVQPLDVRDAMRGIADAVNRFVQRDEWPEGYKIRAHDLSDEGGALMVRVRLLPQDYDEILPQRWIQRVEDPAGEWVTFFSPLEMRNDLFISQDVCNWWLYQYYELAVDALPRPPDEEPHGPYGSVRNIYQAIDEHTEWLFPSYDWRQVAGVFCGFFSVTGAERSVRLFDRMTAVRAMHGYATNLAWFFARALFVRKVDAVTLSYYQEPTIRFVVGMPYGLRTATMPTSLTRQMYPWGALEVLEPTPLRQVSHESSFVGYNVLGAVVGNQELGYIETNANTTHTALAKLDAWFRSAASLVGTVYAQSRFGTTPRFIYTAVPVGVQEHRLVHPFGVPFLNRHRERVNVVNLFARRTAAEGVRLETRAPVPSPFEQFSEWKRFVR